MLEEYHKKRDFTKTPEPTGRNMKQDPKKRDQLKFVVHKHDATKLHYDFRLETKKESVLKSWAVPKGVSLDSKVKRLAVLTDHPLDYLLFEGVIPEGTYGGGTVIVWDTGSYNSEREIADQFTEGKITFSLFGQKLKGRFSLIKTAIENQWLLIKGDDEFKSNEDLTITRPESVLTGKTNQDLENSKKDTAKTKITSNNNYSSVKDRSPTTRSIDLKEEKAASEEEQEEFPIKIKPMLATAVDEPFNDKDWVFEVKWDGVRSIFFLHKTKGIFEIKSRSDKTITHRYPDLIEPLNSAVKCQQSIILDGEIVILDKKMVCPAFKTIRGE